MEAATLTLEEAGSVLEHAYPPTTRVQALREQLAALMADPGRRRTTRRARRRRWRRRAPPRRRPRPSRDGARGGEQDDKPKAKRRRRRRRRRTAKAAKGDGAKGKKGDAAAKGAKGDGDDEKAAKPKAPALSRTGDDDAETVQVLVAADARASRRGSAASRRRAGSLGRRPTCRCRRAAPTRRRCRTSCSGARCSASAWRGGRRREGKEAIADALERTGVRDDDRRGGRGEGTRGRRRRRRPRRPRRQGREALIESRSPRSSPPPGRAEGGLGGGARLLVATRGPLAPRRVAACAARASSHGPQAPRLRRAARALDARLPDAHRMVRADVYDAFRQAVARTGGCASSSTSAARTTEQGSCARR